MYRGLIKGLISSLISPVIALYERWVLNFDGVDDRGQFQYRLYVPNLPFKIKFWTPNSGKSVGVIFAQNATSTFTAREFQLWAATNSTVLRILLGGTESVLGNIRPNTQYELTLNGGNFTLTDARGNIINTGTVSVGTFIEPTASAYISANADGAGFSNFFLGVQRDLEINGITWPVIDRDSAVQLPNSVTAPSISTVNNVNQSSVAFPAAPYVDSFGYTVLTTDGSQTWSYAAFNIPVEPGMTYVIETIADFQGSNIFYGCQNNSSSGAIEIRTVNNVPANKVSRQVVTALANLNRPFMLITRNVPNSAVGVFRHKFLRAFPVGTRTGPQLVINGDFATDVAGWGVNGGASLAWSSGQAVLTVAAQVSSRMERGVVLEAGELYVATADITAASGPSTVRLNIIRSAPGNYAAIQNAQVAAQAGMRITNIFRAPATDALIQIVSGEAVAGSITVDNITLYKLTDVCNPITLANVASTGWQEIPNG